VVRKNFVSNLTDSGLIVVMFFASVDGFLGFLELFAEHYSNPPAPRCMSLKT